MKQTTDADSLVDRILGRDLRAVARAITSAENDTALGRAILRGLFPHTGRGLTVGITGAPGAGKSSLVDRLAFHYREQGKSVGIIAVDPSSPFSGGALLGDRIRMQGFANDPDVFIRSMATRGNLGGLARSTVDAVAVLDAAGYDRILVETVGVGQGEVDIVKAADVSVVVLVPGMGDDIQAIKAGIMEIGDVFVINKAERQGVERTERELISLLEMSQRPDGWTPPIVRTVAIQDRGILELIAAIENYSAFRIDQPAAQGRRTSIVEHRLIELLRESLLNRVLREALPAGHLATMASAITNRERDPYSVVEEIIDQVQIAQNLKPQSSEDSRENSVSRIQHLGVAVTSIEDALAFWRDGLGLEQGEMEIVEDQGVKTAMLPIGESRIELLEPTGAETAVGKFLAKRGQGIHHVCVEVAEVAQMLAKLKGLGIRLIDEEPRRGAGGSIVAFIHPASTGGVLVELVQRGSHA
ncbi:MAG: methylmalonyl Co-A mutase-associated GTPase MeaB [Acidobacteriota bacterium]